MKTKDLENLSQEEFDEVIEATGPAKEGKGNTPVGPGADPELLKNAFNPAIKNPSKKEAARWKAHQESLKKDK